jgi:hypothetical protein
MRHNSTDILKILLHGIEDAEAVLASVMQIRSEHTFHIPVMGLGFTIDTPVKVARFGITSVVSIMEDALIEQMREFHCRESGEEYIAIKKEGDHRAKRITAYLNLLQRILHRQMKDLSSQPFDEDKDIVKYFRLLPEGAPLKELFLKMTSLHGEDKALAQKQLREKIMPGSIDVNIMTKVDNPNYAKDGSLLPPEYSDAISALRGFADSDLEASIIFSAGMNPRLYGFMENIPGFYPDENGRIRKRIILKVSDYRSALIQGKFLAKKGLPVYEFRIESGLNCGGHAFPTEGFLLGPILEEFKMKRAELNKELIEICNQALRSKNRFALDDAFEIRITVQGGIGTMNEDKFLREFYNLDGTGWGSPFLLVPEATNVDDKTLQQIVRARQDDYFLSHASPLGIPFNNFKMSSSEEQRNERILKNRPGSPCYKKHLTFNNEFSEKPVCTASREYQEKKLKSLAVSNFPEDELQKMREEIMEKDCLCEGLAVPALIKNHIAVPHNLTAVTICPGPNMAYFSKVLSLEEMVGHIYGRENALNTLHRPHIFINELKLYIDYLGKEISRNMNSLSEKQVKFFSSFKANLLDGIEYYKKLLPDISNEAEDFKAKMKEELEVLKSRLKFTMADLCL